MKRPTTILLAFSLCLNVGFVAGFIHTRSVLERIATPAGRITYGLERLSLSDDERAAALVVAQQWIADVGQRQRTHEPELQALWQALVAVDGGQASDAELDRLAKVPLDAQREATAASIRYLRRLFACMPPEQRRQVADQIRRNSRF